VRHRFVAIEIDLLTSDAIIRRWQAFSGDAGYGILIQSGPTTCSPVQA
jgi:hypothetical protein